MAIADRVCRQISFSPDFLYARYSHPYHYRDAYRRWSGGYRQRMREILGPDVLRVYNTEWDMWERVPVPAPSSRPCCRSP